MYPLPSPRSLFALTPTECFIYDFLLNLLWLLVYQNTALLSSFFLPLLRPVKTSTVQQSPGQPSTAQCSPLQPNVVQYSLCSQVEPTVLPSPPQPPVPLKKLQGASSFLMDGNSQERVKVAIFVVFQDRALCESRNGCWWRC